mmetsp:Transcript_11684/g.13742  ORF Transcript_11684/g.13742 Transcript_11684/m.13742 type:complete len:129 (+) Transcript_11684:15-401(+)
MASGKGIGNFGAQEQKQANGRQALSFNIRLHTYAAATHLYATMSLRRPPTRIQLKAEDIDEYEQMMRERQMAAEDGMSVSSNHHHHHSSHGGGGGTTPGSGNNNYFRSHSSKPKKRSAAERIGHAGGK